MKKFNEKRAFLLYSKKAIISHIIGYKKDNSMENAINLKLLINNFRYEKWCLFNEYLMPNPNKPKILEDYMDLRMLKEHPDYIKNFILKESFEFLDDINDLLNRYYR